MVSLLAPMMWASAASSMRKETAEAARSRICEGGGSG
jgi:hypothetical protein